MGVVASFVIENPLGVHARPAARIASLAQRYRCDIELRLGEERANAKSIMAVMMLAAGQGAEVHISAEGEDAAEAVSALGELIRSGFAEPSA